MWPISAEMARALGGFVAGPLPTPKPTPYVNYLCSACGVYGTAERSSARCWCCGGTGDIVHDRIAGLISPHSRRQNDNQHIEEVESLVG